jgi:hypothetical protein
MDKLLKIDTDGVPVEDSFIDVDAAGQVANPYTASVALAAVDALYIDAANGVAKAIADNTSKSYLIGFARAAALITANVDVVSEGVLTGFSGLTPTSRYYLSDSTAGLITSTVPTGSGKTIVQAGYAKSSTALQIHIEQMGRRA